MTRKAVQFIREGDYAAEVSVDLLDDGDEWAPTVGLEDIRKLDRVRAALLARDINTAAKDAKVFKLVPQEAEISAHRNLGFGESKQSDLDK